MGATELRVSRTALTELEEAFDAAGRMAQGTMTHAQWIVFARLYNAAEAVIDTTALPIPATGEADAKWRKAAEVVLAEVKINGIPALEFIDKVVTP